MSELEKVLLVTFPSTFLLLLFLILLQRLSCFKKTQNFPENATKSNSSQSGIQKLHLGRKNRAGYHHQQPQLLHLLRYDSKNRSSNNIVWRNGLPGKPFFAWEDNPSLVSEAGENGWAKFAFQIYPSSSSPASLWGLCGVCDYGLETDSETTWEIVSESTDYIQKIRLNPNFKKRSSNVFWVSCVRTGLPLPGPPLGGSSFPQEAYLEITVVSREDPHGQTGVKSEAAVKAQFDDYHAFGNGTNRTRIEELKFVKLEETKDREELSATATGSRKLISLGLAGGNAPPFRYPGSYPGSIGFNSDGSVYLDGMIQNKAGETTIWGEPNMVIGLGFDPAQKKVFFTLESKLVHTVCCKSEVFSSPLFPILAANFDATVLVNLGQCPFKYSPANMKRTSNPCFANASGDDLGYEDSRELFSMGRIDSHWREPSKAQNKAAGDGDEMESEGDLFEIILDGGCNRR